MIRRIDATILFVRDLAACMAFYRDILGFDLKASEPHSVTFAVEDQYVLLLDHTQAADLLGEDVTVGNGAQVLLAAGVENVDDTYQTLLAKGVNFLRPPADR